MTAATRMTENRVGRLRGHRFHGDARRFGVVADFVASRFPEVRYVADVAGGQGLLTRILSKQHNYACEVVDPRGWVLKGVANRCEPFAASMAPYYDLIVGLHPDQAVREVVEAAATTPTVVVPCCNFWDPDRRLGRDALLDAISQHQVDRGGTVESHELAFSGPYNRALVLLPPRATDVPALGA